MNLREMAANAWRDEQDQAAAHRAKQHEEDFNRIKNLLARIGVPRASSYEYSEVDDQAVVRLDGLTFRVIADYYDEYALEMFDEEWPDGACWECASSLQIIGSIIERGPRMPKEEPPFVPAEERAAHALEHIAEFARKIVTIAKYG